MEFILDCSMTMAWLFEEEKTKKSESILTSLSDGDTAYVPALWAWEVGNVLWVAERRKRITRSQATGFTQMLKILPITVEDKAVHYAHNATYELAIAQDLSVYDVAYLEIALRRQVPIASLDKKLNTVAKQLGLLINIG